MKNTLLCFAAFAFSFSLSAQNQTNLKLNLAIGKKYLVKSASEQTVNTSFNGMQQSTQVKSSMVLSMVAKETTAAGIQTEVRLDTITTSTNMGMMKLNINSGKGGNIASSDISEAMSGVMARLSNCKLIVKLSPEGKVLEIYNVQSVTDSVCKGLDTLKGQMSQMILMQSKMMVNETSIKGMIESVTAYLPGKQVKVGEKWSASYILSSSGIGMLISTDYKLKSIADKKAELVGNATIEPSSTEPVSMNGAKINYDVRGLSKSNLKVDIESGWILNGSVQSHSQGNMNVSMSGNNMQVPVEIDNTTTITAL
jgi:hypothetical protein